ncbi:superoxide dismutase[Cu-Zn] [Nocardia donostiensis]|uniref:Superoxide dismutase [Cu-Zn] n=1 Tax=Nocardia donostiensis TaxID=1538463 RepID=A0A1W0BNZ7_9NOCA|nr:superoxide dismutase family protein [Nocardia donostiensis]ONM47601.1 superoxide dismutase [Nocardia donostiensis]OQS15054.1 superoxide dismutase [Nocardia donostiensis]OQS24227.1 superoxide dismutase [Nocardia donostiensis]
MAPSTTRRPSWRSVTPVLAVAAFGLVACTNSQESSDVPGTTPPVFTSSPAPAGAENEHGGTHNDTPAGSGTEVQLKDPSGATVGTADIAEDGDHLRITVEARGLEPGFHGLHFHEVGKCEANSTPPAGGDPGNFLSAGGHLQVGGNNAHPASGDLTSLQVRKDGEGYLVTTTDSVTMADVRGKALMIHAGSDNFGNIPDRYSRDGETGPDETTLSTGDAGGRIACGVVE